MGLSKLYVAVDVLLQPCVTLRDGAIVHVVVEIRVNDRDGGQRVEVGRETGERLIRSRRYVAEVYPRRVFTRIST